MSVHALAKSESHNFTKPLVPQIILIEGLGVEGDCHSGVHVQHRSRLHIQPPPPNLRQVHLIPKEILDEVGIAPGQIGENVTTEGIDLLALGVGTKLHFLPADGDGGTNEPHPVVVIQGLRNPCPQIDKFRAGLKEKFILRDKERNIVGRKAGVMGTIDTGGIVEKGMRIVVERPEVHHTLECV
ncbi:pyruvate kinase-like protein [Podospora aff. communis PSN243]|uniref:Pyruvate kinase-like protein n=1 Tax=Podospora aff. communis PSN243 TaxID=3040156 RepID=A0AAV9GCX5_9PEZI|nr:pyruvate kinase-like protein [Podospora aff. communis PSN243]